MQKINIQYYQTKEISFILGSFSNKLCLVDFKDRERRQGVDSRLQKGLNAQFVEQDNILLRETRSQLDEYLCGMRQQFDLPFVMVGTDFQKSVWHALAKVKYGQTSSYLQLAKDIGNEKAVRAVANANGANAMALIIPCHRIIGSNGTLTGYAGGLPLKARLLKLEQGGAVR
ncbi:methylated-DNA--protein-cysteine methyltransferase [Psychromonas sp. CNPT3]|uniref:methylated-DNA--[protein]-cysteine S-methyltransferase n=1 Tax=Psychromonas sp. CNPT3 TaxID=314282 RepID=UPI00006E70E6|nr:methylated-DNA--[protein]-cysteine S-methyltransferase [Psychromonas sp. CNPT3]AGH81463.1 methylated-DNA--protein-cysteine methyltransferase [Psychromonas sp. CNPT3]